MRHAPQLTHPFSNDMFSTTININTKGKIMPGMDKNKQKKDKNKHMKELNIVDRKKKQHPFLWIFSITILVIIVISFVGAPLLRGFGSSSNELVFGKYGDVEIEYAYGTYFARQLDILQDNYQSNGSDNYQYETYQIWKGAFDRTVFHTAILYSASESGVYISDRKIDKTLTQYGPYMDNGKFSPALYNATPDSDRYANRTIFREELIQQQYLQDIGGRFYSPAELEFIKAMSSTERNFRYVAFPISDYPLEEVSDYGNSNRSIFRKIGLSRISLKDNAKEAEVILNQLKENPALFEELAQNHSTDFYAEKGGDMGQVTYYSLGGDISDNNDTNSIFSLDEDEISALIETPYGYSIYRCNKVSRDPDLTDENELKNILNYMLINEKGMIEDYFITQAGTFIDSANNEGFTEAASSMGLSYYITDYFPINYGNSDFLKEIKTVDKSTYFDTVATDQRFLTSLFSLKADELTEPAIVGDTILVAQMISEQEIAEEELSYMDYYYRYRVNQIQQNELYSTFFDSDLLTNNFMSIFSQYIMAN